MEWREETGKDIKNDIFQKLCGLQPVDPLIL